VITLVDFGTFVYLMTDILTLHVLKFMHIFWMRPLILKIMIFTCLELRSSLCILHDMSFYSAFMIGDGKLLTNAHCVEHDTQVIIRLDSFISSCFCFTLVCHLLFFCYYFFDLKF